VPFNDQQYAALVRLTRRLQRSYPIRHITGHADIAPGRKTDPGPCFDWPRYLAVIKI
ncbi:MAG: N-acetylmuramoyl-L-alanine amidase, partial [Gallionellaceae bacterium]|nr:N-acetylmuramoyl-L-alanine amidase [Gallionellaceae bacterium]